LNYEEWFYATYRSKNKGKDKRSINLSVFLNSLLADNHHLQVGSNYLYIHKIDGKTFSLPKQMTRVWFRR
jgi:hypothetical protein